MSEFVSLLLAAATFIFVAYPLLRRRPRAAPSAADDSLQELYSKRDTTYSMLKELEFDHNSGILSHEDYADLESRYKESAISILKGIDSQRTSATDMEAEIERQIQQLRTNGTAEVDIDAEIERQVGELRQERGPYCSQCGARSRPGNRFCSHCGVKLN